MNLDGFPIPSLSQHSIQHAPDLEIQAALLTQVGSTPVRLFKDFNQLGKLNILEGQNAEAETRAFCHFQLLLRRHRHYLLGISFPEIYWYKALHNV